MKKEKVAKLVAPGEYPVFVSEEHIEGTSTSGGENIKGTYIECKVTLYEFTVWCGYCSEWHQEPMRNKYNVK